MGARSKVMAAGIMEKRSNSRCVLKVNSIGFLLEQPWINQEDLLNNWRKKLLLTETEKTSEELVLVR